jgi:hypothetical protein
MIACCVAMAALPVQALTIREYEASRHDRFTGFPAAPQWNDGAWFDSRSFGGVGWNATDAVNKRQFALVTPRHILAASHALPAVGNVIRFLAADGSIIERTVLGTQAVPNTIGGHTDVAVSRLSSPIPPESGVVHFPYLNLASEAAYLNTALWIFGWQAKVGRGSIQSFSTLNEGSIADTRMMEFRYLKAFGAQDDAYAVSGDSGSPSLAMAGTRPAVVGLHSAVADSLISRVNFDAFIPHYIAGINAIVAPDGYAMTPAYPALVTLEWTVSTEPAVPRQQSPGEWRLALRNTGETVTGNVRVMLEFPAGDAPGGLLAPGWIVESPSATTRKLRRAALAAEETTMITASWTALPEDPIPMRVTYESDGSPQQVTELELQPAPSYKAWSYALAAPAADADGDGDGVSNLLEYALGGDASVPSRFSLSGAPLQPEPLRENGRAVLRFLIREDAALRGISYGLEFSGDLSSGSWSAAVPPGLEINDRAAVPAVTGFVLREVSFDPPAGRFFCRLHISLDESSILPPSD